MAVPNRLRSKQPKFLFISVVILILIGLSSLNCSKRTEPELEKVFIPAGEFIMGSDDINLFASLKKEFGFADELFIETERPVRNVNLKSFIIDKYEVTNRAYKLFCDNMGYPVPPNWINGKYPSGQAMHSVTNVSWFHAFQYCAAVGKRLPTEKEWEKAARGPNGNRHPWGNEFDIKKANFERGATAPVGSFPEDKSYYGVYDMGGNVMEWTDSWFKSYPGASKQSENYGEKYKVLKGWSGTDIEHYNLANINSRSSARHYLEQDMLSDDIGFRCAWEE